MKPQVQRSAGERKELGRRLVAARKQWPRSGPRAKGWSRFLFQTGIDDSTAWRYMARALDPDAPRPAADQSAASSGVYFIQGADGGPIKIGVSQDIMARLKDLQCGSPVPLRLVSVRAGDQATERELHRRLAPHRLHGEWFADVPDVRAEIAGGQP